MQQAELEVFVELPDRAPSPVFVGRDVVFRDLDSGIRLARLGRSEGAALVVYGAPGAGKTALMHEAKKRWDLEQEQRPGQAPLAIKVDASAVNSPHRAVLAMLRAVYPDSDFFSRQAETTTGSGKVGIPGVAQGSFQTAMEAAAPSTIEAAMQDPIGFFEHACRPSDWTRPVCLMIDEAQTVCGYPERGESNEFLLHLHASNYPVLMLFGGLGNTLDALEQVGLSRTSVAGVQGLPLLTVEEAASAVYRFLDLYRIPATSNDRAKIAESIAMACSGWPQHLHCYLAETGRIALRNGRLNADDWPEIESGGSALREKIYRQRLNGFGAMRAKVAAIIASVPEKGLDPEVVSATAYESVGPPDAATWGGGRFLAAMIRKGILHDDSNTGQVICPIPSFRDFLAREYPGASMTLDVSDASGLTLG